MNRILIILLFVASMSFQRATKISDTDEKQKQLTISMLENEFRSLHVKYDNKRIKEVLNDQWLVENKDVIQQKNPDFNLNDFDSASFIFIPSLKIPKEVIEDGNINLVHYIAQGELSIEESQIFVIKDSLLVGTLVCGFLGVTPEKVGKTIQKARIDELKKAKFFFKLNFVGNDSYSPMPGIIYFKNNEFFVLSEYGEVYPLSQIHKLLWETPKQFQKHLNAIKRRG